MNMDNAEQLLGRLQELLTLYGMKILAALAILFIGQLVARWVRRVVHKLLTRGHTDPMIVGFVASIAYVGMMVFVVLAALGQIGIQTTSVMFRPFKVEDFIEGAGVSGIVEEIQIFTTTLRTPDNKTVIVPNAKLLNDNITNYSSKATRRVDLTVGISYNADLAEAKRILADIVQADARVKAEPEPLVAVSDLADNSVNLVLRVWTDTSDYWPVRFDTVEAIKRRFDEAGIGIPYPQRDVHLYEHKAA
jgi:small conductance mechanosensitive channel